MADPTSSRIQSVAVIDVGSNTIKILIANQTTFPKALLKKTLNVRIGEGLGKENPQLKPECIKAGVQAVKELVQIARKHEVDYVEINATSAVRDASNGIEFLNGVKQSTGLELQILSGNEEAENIALGIASDPKLKGINSFSAFDLGGGSLECVLVESNRLLRGFSLPLGAVRLTERFFKRPCERIPKEEITSALDYIGNALAEADLSPGLCPEPFVATGGAFSATASIFSKNKQPIKEVNTVSTEFLEELLWDISAKPLDERVASWKGLPRARADIMPAALAVYATLGKRCRVQSFLPSNYNLRFGRARFLLGRTTHETGVRESGVDQFGNPS